MSRPDPTTSEARRLPAADRREQLLDAALDVFARKGFEGASTREIARSAGVAEGLLYHYFETKAQLLWAVIDRSRLRNGAAPGPAPSTTAPVGQVLRGMGQDLLALLASERQVTTLVLGERHRSPECALLVEALVEGWVGTVRVFLDDRAARGELRGMSMEPAARMFIYTLVMHFAAHAAGGPEPAESERLLESAIVTLLDGLRQT